MKNYDITSHIMSTLKEQDESLKSLELSHHDITSRVELIETQLITWPRIWGWVRWPALGAGLMAAESILPEYRNTIETMWRVLS